MKGTELTPEQLQAAEKFILGRSNRAKRPEMILQRFDDLVRLVAWYGALRYKSARNGTGGSLEAPMDYGEIPHEKTA